MKDQDIAQVTLPLMPETVVSDSPAAPETYWPKKKVGRYEIRSVLGVGGMGVVLKAHDPELDRSVAIKVLRVDDDVLRQRFLHEAVSQARVEHPHVCRVFDTGEHESQPFIVMQYVQGEDLKLASRGMTVEEKAKIVKEAAEGLQAAHTMGLIHRDVKPANILVEKGAAGEWVPYLTDFGLAREQEGDGLTKSGDLLGTPHYMSPEQVRGEVRKLDRRTDVYSLGATLYELLAGEPPFAGEGPAQVLVHVIMSDPPPLRRRCPYIPADLATIAMKCLSKDPLHRYQSARALADDLGRFLAGEPISARPISLLGRLAGKLRRHKAVTVSLAFAFLLVLGFAGYAFQTWRNAREQATLAERFGREAKEIESIMRIAYMLPLHDIRPEKGMVRQRMKELEAGIGRQSAGSAAFAHYALGRGFLALHEFRPALRELTLAVDSGLKTPEVQFALGRVLGELYKEAKDNVSRLDDPAVRSTQLKELDGKYRTPAIRCLQAGQGVKGESPAFVHGLMAFYEGRYREAIHFARQAAREIPWLYEARALEGKAWLEIGAGQADRGEYEGAFQSWKQAELVLRQALGVARSDDAVLVDYERLWGEEMAIREASGQDSGEAFRKADEACRLALTANPDNAWAYCLRSRLLSRWAGHQLDRGENPDATLKMALASAEASARLDPNSAWPLIEVGGISIVQAYAESTRGGDPRPPIDQGIRSLQRAARINPNDYSIYDGIGNLWQIMAIHEYGNGGDPRAAVDQGIAAFEKALRMAPSQAYLCNNLGYLRDICGQFERERGLDPEPAFRRALADYRRAAAAMPEDPTAFNGAGVIHNYLALIEMKAGKDPLPTLAEAKTELEKSTRLNAQASSTWLNLGYAYVLEGDYALSQGLDPRPAVARASAMYQRALDINPQDYFSLRELANALRIQGEYESDHGLDPTASLDRARKLLAKAHQIAAQDLPAYFRESQVACLGARWASRMGRSPLPSLAAAASACDCALRLSSGKDFLFQGAAEMWRMKAEWLLKNKQDAGEALSRGLAMTAAALKLNPRSEPALAEQGVLHLLQADAAAEPELRKGLAAKAEAELAAATRADQLLQRPFRSYLNQARRMSAEAR